MPIEQTHEPLKLDTAQRADKLRWATAACFKAGGIENPSGASSVKMRELACIVLHGAAGVLAVYRALVEKLA
jgi:hypothetical protein